MTDDPHGEDVLSWTSDGQPRSRLYGDVYFSVEDGLAESRAVFLRGCGLPDAWAGRRRFTVGELGFGSGLNILALMDLWRAQRPTDAQLHIFTIEAHLLTATEAARALAAWPELADLATLLIARWPGKARGFHRIDLPELHCLIDVAVMEVGKALAAWTGRADAWFLDGFSPSLNPAMWRAEILQAVADRSAPGARAATFTVAGQVRRDLAAAGFAVEKRPGFGRKRERLEALLPGGADAGAPAPSAAVVGAGIAGASLARALRALGIHPVVVEADARGAGASGNPAALVTPRLDAGLGPPAQLFAQAFARAVALFDEIPGAVVSRGARQLATAERDAARFAKIAASDLFEPGDLVATETALSLASGRVVAPDALLAAWLPQTHRGRVARLDHDGEAWRLLDAEGAVIARADVVVLANGAEAQALWPSLPVSPVRGQTSWSREVAFEGPAVAWGGYAIPLGPGVLFGATHDRGDEGRDVRPDDHERNRATLAQGLPDLAGRLGGLELEGRASTRAATPDRLPLAGQVPDAPPGLFVLSGLGSRGFTLAPLLAEHLSAQIAGAPSPLPAQIAALVAPDRFALRRARRAGQA